MSKTKVVLGQLGSPKSDSIKDVRAYLKEFLGDPRVVDLPRFFWMIILNFFVLPFRPKKSAKAYSRIYDGESFPLITLTNSFVDKISPLLDENIEINSAFILSHPRIDDLLNEWEKEDFNYRANELVIIPQFPQYSESTVASVFDIVGVSFKDRVNIPDIRFITNYHKLKAFIDLSAKKIEDTLKDKSVDELVISFHGIPTRRVTEKKDEYYFHCYETFTLLKSKLSKEFADKIHMCFQSRFGQEKWLGPATDEFAIELAKSGSKSIAVYCPSFVIDCLETTDEIGNELREDLKEHSCELIAIDCLNDDDNWVRSYSTYINTLVNGSKKELESLFYQTNKNELRDTIPHQETGKPKLDDKARSSLNIMFLTLFLDLVGFSIIFPLFPSMAKYYLLNDRDSVILNFIFSSIESFTSMGGAQINNIVLFGGILGALYSLLQFIFSPIWGKLSDKYGREPILKISILGIFISYCLWIFSGSFTLLIISRIIGGVMGGNISVATAVASDVTNKENRSRAMAFVGIAFALGFLIGPALGGIFSLVDLSQYANLSSLGVNPFSTPALVAALLALLNFIIVFKYFKETNLNKNSNAFKNKSFNPIKLLIPMGSSSINTINYSYFLFISIFSGMEFTLTFLALERLGFSSTDNAFMFIYIGLILAIVQGGYVRAKAREVGEKKMAIRGLALIIPGLFICAQTSSAFILFLGLTFLSLGSSLIIPTLTSLVSFYSEENRQGEHIGTFRSLGSLGRVLGPIAASLMFWKYGSEFTYTIAGCLIILPLIILTRLKKSGSI